jgi:hypothetical protein
MAENGSAAIIERGEWRFVWFVILMAVIVTCVPYVYGWLTTPAGREYTGIHELTPGDVNVYYSFIEQARQGNFLFQNLYSPEVKQALLFHPQWNLLAVFADGFNLSNTAVFQLSRVFLLAVFLVLLYVLFSNFFKEIKWRRLCLALAVFATGLGLFIPVFDMSQYLQGEFSVDLWVPEALTFLTIFHNPLFILSLIIILSVFIIFLKDQDRGGYGRSAAMGLLVLLLGFIHPYDLFIVFSVLGAYLVSRVLFDDSFVPARAILYFKKLVVILLVALPSLVYYYCIYNFIDGYKGWGSQNVTMSPSFWWYVTGYGLIGVLGVIGLILAIKRRKKEWLFVGTWFVVIALALYFPLQFQRRMSEGLHVPMVMLAVSAICLIFAWLKNMRHGKLSFFLRTIFIWLFVVASFSTTVYLIARDMVAYKTKDIPYYLASSQVDGFGWLKANTPTDTIVLSERVIGNFIPAYTGRKVYYGHSDLSSQAEEKKEALLWFFDGTQGSVQEKKQFLRANSVDYIYYQKKDANDDWLIRQSFAEKVFDEGLTVIFRVL